MPDQAPPVAIRGDLDTTVQSLMSELDALSRIIADARQEVAALRADDSDVADIPGATDELAAIVSHTAQATHEILDSCEALETVAARVGDTDSDVLQHAITRIYEACSFQDITGQRIAKVVAALQAVERRIARARQGIPDRIPAIAAAATLLNGPQLPGNGISQSAIDALFD